MDKILYQMTRQNLGDQLTLAKAIVKSYEGFAPMSKKPGGIDDYVGDAWSAAERMAAAIEADIDALDQEWDWRVPATARQLVAVSED